MNNLEIKDQHKNTLVIEQKAPYQVFIKQADEERTRMVGYLEPDQDGTFTYKKHEKESDIYRKTKAWSIHARILDFAQRIEYTTNRAVYTIDTIDAKTRSGRMLYKNASYTQKVYVPIKFWNIEFKEEKDQKLCNRLGYDWWSELRSMFTTAKMLQLSMFLRDRYKQTTVYPPAGEIFNAFKKCSLLDTKVVIIGQDPYHDGSAHGLAFSIREGQTKIPPSLRNILKEVQDDYYAGNFAFKSAHSPTLTRWTTQGVLLLNKTLTVEAGKPNSHKKQWDSFVEIVIRMLIEFKTKRNEPLVFILWGKDAQACVQEQKSDLIHIIKAPHPAAEAYSGGNSGFFGSKPFTKCNKFLEKYNLSINW